MLKQSKSSFPLMFTFILALVLGSSITTPTAKAQTGRTVRIAVAAPLTGAQAIGGQNIRNAVDLAIRDHGAAIEALGYTIELIPFDDEANPDIGINVAQQIIADEAVYAVIGHRNSGVSLLASELYARVDLAMLTPSSTNPRVTERNLRSIHRLCGRDDVQGTIAADFIVNTLKSKSVFISHDGTLYGEGIATILHDNLTAAEITIAGEAVIKDNDDLAAKAKAVAQTAPDMVYYGGVAGAAADWFKALRAAGVKAQFMGPDGMATSEIALLGGKAVVGLMYTTTTGTPFLYAQANPAAQAYIDAYQLRFGAYPEPIGPEAYAATQVTLAAIEKAIEADRLTRRQVARNIRASKDFETIIGKVTFDKKGDNINAQYYIFQITSDDPDKFGQNELITTLTSGGTQ
jgi:branched-chain amino acid transport system substrate-binding protein